MKEIVSALSTALRLKSRATSEQSPPARTNALCSGVSGSSFGKGISIPCGPRINSRGGVCRQALIGIFGLFILLAYVGQGAIAHANAPAQATPVSNPALTTPGPVLKWKIPLEIGYGTPAIADATLYYPEENGVSALDLRTMTTKWRFDTGLRSDNVIDPLVADATVVFGITSGYVSGNPDTPGSQNGYVYALDARTGQQKWRRWADYGTVTNVAVADGIVYFGDGTWVRNGNAHLMGNLYAVELETGDLIWKVTLSAGTIRDTPVVANGIVYFFEYGVWKERGFRNNHLYALDARTGRQIWRFDARDETYDLFGLTVAANTLYMVSEDYVSSIGYDRLYALDAQNGKQKWVYEIIVGKPRGEGNAPCCDGLASIDTPSLLSYISPVSASAAITSIYKPQPGISNVPTFDGNSIYLAVNVDTGVPQQGSIVPANVFEYYLLAVDMETGNEKWRYNSQEELAPGIAHINGSVVFGNVLGVTANLYSVDVNTGQLRWSFAMDDFIAGPSIVSEGVVYFQDYDDNLYAVVPPGSIGMPVAGGPDYPLILALIAICASVCISLGMLLKRPTPNP